MPDNINWPVKSTAQNEKHTNRHMTSGDSGIDKDRNNKKTVSMLNLPHIKGIPHRLLPEMIFQNGVCCKIGSVSWPAFPYCPEVFVHAGWCRDYLLFFSVYRNRK
ncbi:MAG: hypothetical protein JW874_07765 [Spirochaetales bacterium]|nr:hypothetical protein [Spirochaetales bacterium]